jgi:hypothetical protein
MKQANDELRLDASRSEKGVEEAGPWAWLDVAFANNRRAKAGPEYILEPAFLFIGV